MSTLTCAEARMGAMALADGETIETDRSAIEAHVSECADCRVEIEGLRAAGEMLSGRARREARADVWPAIEARAAEHKAEAQPAEPNARQRTAESTEAFGAWQMAAAAAVVVALTAGFFYLARLEHGLRPSPSQVAEEGVAPPKPNPDGEHGTGLAPDASRPEVFVNHEQIWVRMADGKEKQLTTEAPNHGNMSPVLSPDGKRVAFIRDLKDDPLQLMVLDMATGEASVRKLTTSGYGTREDWRDRYVHGPVHWSPDGAKIAFIRNGQEEGRWIAELWLVDVNSAKVERVQRGKEFAVAPWAVKADARLASVLITMLESNDFYWREYATDALRDMGVPAHNALRESYARSKDPEVRKRIKELLEFRGDPAIHLMLIEAKGAERFEYRYLKSDLIRDEKVRPDIFLAAPETGIEIVHFSGKSGNSSFPDSAAEMNINDALVIGDVDPKVFGEKETKQIKEFVQNGGGLILIAGQNFMPKAYADGALGELLPVEPMLFTKEWTEQWPATSKLALTIVGQTSDWTRVDPLQQVAADTWASLPKVDCSVPAFCAKEKANLIATFSMPQVDEKKRPFAIVAWMNYGKGRVLYIGSDDLWKWRRDAKAGEENPHTRFYRNALRFAAAARIEEHRKANKATKEPAPPVKQTQVPAQNEAQELAPAGQAPGNPIIEK